MKKILSLILAVALVLSLCSGIAFAEDKRVLSFGTTNTGTQEALESSIFDAFKAENNIEFKVIFWDDDSYATAVAGGDLPDVVVAHGNMSNVLSNGLALNMEGYIDEYAPNLKEGLGMAYANASRQFFSNDGNLYVICSGAGLNKPQPGQSMDNRGYVVNWEWYKELGCPQITNDDEYIDVLLQMKANHPTTADGKPVYLFGVQKGLNNFIFRANWRSDIATNPWTNYYLGSDIYTNDVYNTYVDDSRSAYWADMEFYNKIYRLGEFDLDSFTRTGDEYKAMYKAGQFCGLFKGQVDDGYVLVPSAGMTYYANAELPLGDAPSAWLFISANTQNADLAMKYVNLINDEHWQREWYSNKEGEYWAYDENGVPAYNDSYYEAKEKAAADSSFVFSYGRCQGIQVFTTASRSNFDGYPLDLAMTRDVAIKGMKDILKDFCEVYNVEYWYDAFDAAGVKDYRNDIGEAICSAMTELSLDDQRVLEECQEILEAGIATMIFSETDEDFEQNKADIIQEIKDLGEEEVFATYQGYWNEIRDVMVPIHNASMEAMGFELYPVD